MARIKYYDSVTQQWVYGDMALQPPLPTGTANGDIPVWDNTNQEWVVKPKWQIHFQPVEYIESTGTQYINTGVVIKSGTRIVAKEALSGTSPSYNLSGLVDGNNNYPVASWGYTTAKVYFQAKYGVNSNSWESTGVALDTAEHIWDIQSGSQKFDGIEFSQVAFTAVNPQSAKNILLFGRWEDASNSNVINLCSSLRGISYKIYENDTLVRDLVPCYRISDGVIGMYDTVNNVFYTNSGSGTFTKGADV